MLDPRSRGAAELADGEVQRRGQRAAQRLLRAGLQLAGPPAAPDRGRAQGVQQHRLADPAQTGEHDAALRTAPGHPLQHHLERFELAVPPGQLGWALPGAGGVGVADRIHSETVSGHLAQARD